MKHKVNKIMKDKRKTKNLTQIQLARKVNVTKDYISMIERGIKTPSTPLAKKLADILDTTIDELFFTSESNYKFDNSSKKGA